MLIAVVFHVPAAYNDGERVSPELLNRMIDQVIGRTGGATVIQAFGIWVDDDGDRLEERLYRVMVGIEEDKVDDFVSFIDQYIRTDFEQKTVWIEVDGKPSLR
jgi:hypothetical protein